MGENSELEPRLLSKLKNHFAMSSVSLEAMSSVSLEEGLCLLYS